MLRSTASGIYGGGATGGVVNIIMRRDYTGTEAKLSYGSTFQGGGTRKRVDITGGYSFLDGKVNLLVAGTYNDDNGLHIRDRDLLDRRARAFENSPDTYFDLLSTTTNIVSISGESLTLKGGGLLASPRTFVPIGYEGLASDNGAALISNAGRLNLDVGNDSQLGNRSMLAAPTLKSASVTLRQTPTSKIDTFLKAAISKNSSTFEMSTAPSVLFMPSDAPANPFNEDVYVSFPIPSIDTSSSSTVESRRMAAGASFQISDHWHFGLDYTWNRATVDVGATDLLDDIAATDAISTGTADIFRDVGLYPIDLSYALQRGYVRPYQTKTTLRDASLRASGQLPVSLRGGAPSLSASVERRNEIVGETVAILAPSPATLAGLLTPKRTQRVNSAYMELVLPIVSEMRPIAAIDMLEMQIALRRDQYTISGARSETLNEDLDLDTAVEPLTNRATSTDPTAAIRYRPLRDLMMRVSYGTGFLPPTVSELIPNAAPFPLGASVFGLFGVTDPLRNNEVLGTAGAVSVLQGGNQGLRPEESKSWSVGIVLEPRSIAGLRLSIDWTKIEKRNAIAGVPFEEQLVSLLTRIAPERITREATTSGFGPITALDLTNLNFAKAETEAYDYSAEYVFPNSSTGNWTVALSATELRHSRSQATANSPFVENAGVLNVLFGNIKWRSTAGLKWAYRDLDVAWTSRYYGSYYLTTDHEVLPGQGAARVESQLYHDVSIGYHVRGAQRYSILAGSVVQIGVTNIFNDRPPFDARAVNQNYYSDVGDPRLGAYYVSIRGSF